MRNVVTTLLVTSLFASLAHAQTPEPPPESPKQAEVKRTPEDEATTLRMRDLQERVNALKEDIFRSKARLMLLREIVLEGKIAGAKAIIAHKNEMGSAFKLMSVSYALDGAPLYTRADKDGDLSDREVIEIYSGAIAPGNHNLAANLVYQGNGYGVFSYLKDYKFNIRSSYAFSAEEGHVTTITATGYEKGGITAELKDKPNIRFDVKVLRLDAAQVPTTKTEN